MAAVAQRQRLDARDVVEGERRVKMREQARRRARPPISARRRVSMASMATSRRSVLAGEMFRRRFFDLIRGREMDEAVREVDGGAAEDARRFSRAPLGLRRRFCK